MSDVGNAWVQSVLVSANSIQNIYMIQDLNTWEILYSHDGYVKQRWDTKYLYSWQPRCHIVYSSKSGGRL